MSETRDGQHEIQLAENGRAELGVVHQFLKARGQPPDDRNANHDEHQYRKPYKPGLFCEITEAEDNLSQQRLLDLQLVQQFREGWNDETEQEQHEGCDDGDDNGWIHGSLAHIGDDLLNPLKVIPQITEGFGQFAAQFAGANNADEVSGKNSRITLEGLVKLQAGFEMGLEPVEHFPKAVVLAIFSGRFERFYERDADPDLEGHQRAEIN